VCRNRAGLKTLKNLRLAHHIDWRHRHSLGPSTRQNADAQSLPFARLGECPAFCVRMSSRKEFHASYQRREEEVL
jgi:hypothetical protein